MAKPKRVSKFRPTLYGTDVSMIVTAVKAHATSREGTAIAPLYLNIADRLTAGWARWLKRQDAKRRRR